MLETGVVTSSPQEQASENRKPMKNDYQLGSDDDWLKHSNEELAQLIKKRDRRIVRLQLGIVVLLAVLGWVVYKFSQKAPLPELWHFQLAQREFLSPPDSGLACFLG